MKAVKSFLLIIMIILLVGCSSKESDSKNPHFTYGTLQNDNIEAVFDLEGNPTQQLVEDYSQGVAYGSKGSYFINVCETTSGGVVAYGEGKYVYSPDKNDKDDVRNALIQECVKNND